MYTYLVVFLPEQRASIQYERNSKEHIYADLSARKSNSYHKCYKRFSQRLDTRRTSATESKQQYVFKMF